ncbi:MAG: Hsp33 family molecular chaperone HslO [Polyangiaceae bacterium]|jgi:molecular chaperone Hsp33
MNDTALRAITEDGAFRVIAIRTTETVRGACDAQDAQGDVRRLFSELLTGSILIRHTMAPDLRVQAILQGDDRSSRMVADANPDGSSRGLVQMALSSRMMPVSKQGVLQVARTLHDGSIHQGVVAVPEDGSISGALMRYMQASEQIVSIIAAGCDLDDAGRIRAAGGFVLQLLPELDEGPLAVMTERMRDFEKMGPLFARGIADPESLVREILYGMPYAVVGNEPLRFGCNCSQARVAASLASLPKREIQAMIDDRRVLEIGCDYCGSQYQMAPEQLRGLLEAH